MTARSSTLQCGGTPVVLSVTLDLPARLAPAVDARLMRKFLVAITSVGCKLADERQSYPIPSCFAEEAALHALVLEAAGVLVEQGLDADFTDFDAAVFEDDDREWAVVREPWYWPVSLDHWFESFHGEELHPYLQNSQ
jgi:hypothetical protein